MLDSPDALVSLINPTNNIGLQLDQTGGSMMDRRQFLLRTAALPLAAQAPLLTLSGRADAQAAWPERNITFIVPFPAGGQADLAARPVGAALEKILGRPVVIGNDADLFALAEAGAGAGQGRDTPSSSASFSAPG